jgi:hypothetical protein
MGEGLERRTLLAGLVFQDASLASDVAITPTSGVPTHQPGAIPDVNTAHSVDNNLEQSNNLYYSENILSTTPSPDQTSNLLDIVSRGGLTAKSLFNVSQTAGLATGGNPGDVVVNITPTDPSEKAGDKVTVQLTASFQVLALAQQNAEATVTDDVHYTYNGGAPVSLLAASGQDLQSGEADPGSAAFQAQIGDSFTLHFSDGVSIKSIAPFGFNNGGYKAELSLKLSVKPLPKPKIAPQALDWSANGGVDFSYLISDADLTQATPITFFWASGSDFTKDVLQQVGYSYTIPAGTQAQTQAYGPIHIDGSKLTGAPGGTKYLLAVADPNNTLGDFDPQTNVTGMQLLLSVQPVYQNLGYWASSPGYLLGHSVKDTIASSGCALTSLVMALDFAGVQTDPAILNKLLTISPNGYSGKDTLNWGPATAIAAGAANDFTVHWNSVITSDPQQLRDLLTSTGAPIIVHVDNEHPANSTHPNGYTTDHFVLVTGIDGDTFWINDPGYTSRKTLDVAAYGNDFETRGYVSDPTDVSALYVASSSAGTGLDFAVSGPQGLITGMPPGGRQPLSQMPNAVYFVVGAHGPNLLYSQDVVTVDEPQPSDP